MLTADQRQVINGLVPKVQAFLGIRQGVPNFPTNMVKQFLEITFIEGYCTGMVKMELFTLGNSTEGLRVQHGNTHQYLEIRSR